MNSKPSSYAVSLEPQTRVPWLTFLGLFMLFYFSTHNFYVSTYINPNTWVADIISTVSEGRLQRQITFSMLGLFGVVGIVANRRNRLGISDRLGLLILLYVAWCFLSLAWAQNFPLSTRRLVVFLSFCVASVAVAKHLSLRDIVPWLFYTSVGYLIFGVFAELVLGNFRPFTQEYRFAGTIHPNHQGLNCAILVLSAIAMARLKPHRRKLFYSCSIVAAVFLILTGSRTSFASAIVGIFCLWYLTSGASRKVVVFGLIILFLCVSFLLFGEELLSTLEYGILLGRTQQSPTELSGRWDLWRECMEYVAERPFLGFGYGGFWDPKRVADITETQGWAITGSHSAYVELLLNVGTVGLVLCAFVLWTGVRKAARMARRSSSIELAFVVAILVCFMLVGVLENFIVDPTFFTFSGMVCLAALGFRGSAFVGSGDDIGETNPANGGR